MSKHPFEQVREFHESFNQLVAAAPELPDTMEEGPCVRKLRRDLLAEEYKEYTDAEDANDFTEIADALADMMYIICGTAVSYGIPLDRIFDEVHASNMSKLGEDGKPIYREDGKVLKGPNFFRPDIGKFLK